MIFRWDKDQLSRIISKIVLSLLKIASVWAYDTKSSSSCLTHNSYLPTSNAANLSATAHSVPLWTEKCNKFQAFLILEFSIFKFFKVGNCDDFWNFFSNQYYNQIF